MAGQADAIKSSLRFRNYIVEEIKFKANQNFVSSEAVKIDFNVNREIKYDNENNTALVTLDVNVFENASSKNYPFYFYLRITGFFEVDSLKSTIDRNLIETNSIAILFPYVRALISTYTANANVNPLILPPINVLKLIHKNSN
jgi:preprotein translocase subunit SecB